MLEQIKKVKEGLPLEYHDTPQFAHHVWEALDHLEEEHRKEVADAALAGIKQNPIEEKVFFDTITRAKKVVMDELRKTAHDIRERGNKYEVKEYKDGVR